MMTERELAADVLAQMRDKGATLATAESCTGGWLGKHLTDIPGSSAAYLGGVVSYTNAVKRELLGVSQGTLDRWTAVSWQTASEMARGVRCALGATLGVGITGLAGPDGDGSGRPVGLVYIAVSRDGCTRSRRLLLTGNREQVRLSACREALQFLQRELENL